MLHYVSLSTVGRRMSHHDSRSIQYSDTELDCIVTLIQHNNPDCGYRLMQGNLARLGYRIQQCRIHESMARTDPLGMISRWCSTVQRREYSVASPNQLWHIDGNYRPTRYAFFNLICISRPSVSMKVYHAWNYSNIPCTCIFLWGVNLACQAWRVRFGYDMRLDNSTCIDDILSLDFVIIIKTHLRMNRRTCL